MKILQNIEIVDLALYFDKTLIISDVHIGYEESMNKRGIFVPRLQFEEIVKRMEKIFARLKDKKIEKILINGDLKDEFGMISEQEWRNTLKFLDLLGRRCGEVVLIKGNHDHVLEPIARKRNVRIVNSMAVGKVLVTHGDAIPENVKDFDTIVIGHEHPAVTIREGARNESYKCFLKGEYRRKNLIVQPSLNTIVEGTDLLRDETLSPFLKQNLDNFEVYVVEDEIYRFGRLRNLRERD